MPRRPLIPAGHLPVGDALAGVAPVLYIVVVDFGEHHHVRRTLGDQKRDRDPAVGGVRPQMLAKGASGGVNQHLSAVELIRQPVRLFPSTALHGRPGNGPTPLPGRRG